MGQATLMLFLVNRTVAQRREGVSCVHHQETTGYVAAVQHAFGANQPEALS